MDFIGLAIAFIGLVSNAFAALGHVAPVCLHAPVAIHASANAGMELDPSLHASLIGQVPTC